MDSSVQERDLTSSETDTDQSIRGGTSSSSSQVEEFKDVKIAGLKVLPTRDEAVPSTSKLPEELGPSSSRSAVPPQHYQIPIVDFTRRPSTNRRRGYMSGLKTPVPSLPSEGFSAQETAQVPTSCRPGDGGRKSSMQAMDLRQVDRGCSRSRGIHLKPRRDMHVEFKQRPTSVWKTPRNPDSYKAPQEAFPAYGTSWKQPPFQTWRAPPRGRMVTIRDATGVHPGPSFSPPVRKRPVCNMPPPDPFSHSAACKSCVECRGARPKTGHISRSRSPRRDINMRRRSSSPFRYLTPVDYSVPKKLSPLGKSPEKAKVEVEKTYSDKALRSCQDTDVKKILSYDHLKTTYKTLSVIKETGVSKGLSVKGSIPVSRIKVPEKEPVAKSEASSSENATTASKDDDLRVLLTFPNRILERCWFLGCASDVGLRGCLACYLTFCRRHAAQDVHGCAVTSFDYGSRLRKPSADYASSKVKMLGREVEKKTINPETCNCSGHCYTCKYAGAYNKYFGPKSALVPEDDQQYAQSASDMDANGNGKRDIPKLRDIIRRQRQDSDGGGADSPDLDFVYDDTDSAANEIAELYSYTEQPEFLLNVKAFEDQMEQYNFPPSWQKLSTESQKSIVMKLLDQLEISNKVLRMRAARCVLYICQGCWAEVQSDTEQQDWAHRNSLLLFELGVFSAFTDLLNIEIENSAAAHVAMRKLAVSLADSQDLRVILAVLYTITEAIRNEKKIDSSEHRSQVDTFTNEIVNTTGDDLLVIKLLSMVTRFCSGQAPHFPMKKVLLLLWKLILVSLGGMEELRQAKQDKRCKVGLPQLDEDTVEIAKNMRASSPPASASDLLETQNQKRNIRMFRRNLMKQSSLDDHDSITMVLEGGMSGIGEEIMKNYEYDERRPTDNNERQMYGDYQQRPMTPPIQIPIPRGLPWKPKVRQRDIDNFLKNVRMKFIGYALQDDRDCLAGLPQPIHEGVKTLKEHMYTSLADLQIQKEEEIARIPLSSKEEEIEMTPTEVLYQAMLPNLPQYMIALLKILLAAAPTSKPKTDSINIVSDVLPEEMPMTVVQSMKLGLDVNRHKEIIVKAVSAILLLLLKHFKLNHVCQFEFMSQHLVFANCIPLVLKFFNQHVMTFVAAINMIPILDFPACVIGDQPELTAESLEIGYAAPYSWRNIYSCINLLRILNKLTKWKHSRIMMLVVFKSAPILKRTLKVRHAMTQLYVLKLLKMQTKYLGRQWRKSNMKTISAIYAKVRHHLNDDWAFGNDLDARPWDFQGEECALRASVDRFNNRRYSSQPKEADFEPVDNCINSVLGANHDLSEHFKKHYRLWLEQEVYNVSVDWDKLLLN